jgi:pSer/pThr/pTyr-binding forkhead associated (FHA) protein
MPKLVIKNLKTEEEQEYSLHQDTILFGRTNTCDIELPSKSISRKHAEITRDLTEFYLTDLRSGNGTFLNNNKLKPMEKSLLRSGDVIKMEEFEIHFILSEEGETSPFEEDTDSDILEVKLIKKMLKSLGTDELPSIEVLNGVAAGKKMVIPEDKTEVVIGRDKEANLTIDEHVISRHHAKLEKKWGGIVLINLESKNGCFVNNEKIEEKLLRDGDKVMLGTVKLLYRNPKDVNLEVITQEISRKKREAAQREAEILAEKQKLEEEKAKAAEAAKAEELEKSEEPASPEETVVKPSEEKETPSLAETIPSEQKPKFSNIEKLMIIGGAVVGIVALGGLLVLLLK